MLRAIPAILAILAQLYVSAAYAPNTLTGQVTHVRDGDTIELNGGETVVRLHAIDAPESEQRYGPAATERVRELVAGETVRVERIETGPYGRTIGVVHVADTTLRTVLLRDGLAWFNRRYSDSERLHRLERTAREAELGLWSQDAPTPPWVYREQD